MLTEIVRTNVSEGNGINKMSYLQYMSSTERGSGMRGVIPGEEERCLPKDGKSVKCKSLYFLEKKSSIIKTMTRVAVALVDSGDGGFMKERRTFARGGDSL